MKEDNDKKKSRMANNEDAEIQMQMGEQRIKKETTMGNIRVNRRIIKKQVVNDKGEYITNNISLKRQISE